MTKTNYTIEYIGTTISILEDYKPFTKGFTDLGSAMHSCWVSNGKNTREFYHAIGSEVFLEVRDAS